jgi:predicted GIY-YIG superfamily endonuclease
MSAVFKAYVGQLEDLLKKLVSAEILSLENVSRFPAVGACYALIEDSNCLYDGISKNLKQRMRNHTSGRGEQSVFAFKLARELANKRTRYIVAESRKALMKNEEFSAAMILATLRVKKMGAKFVQIEDPVLRYLFELYATLSLEAPYNDFRTH